MRTLEATTVQRNQSRCLLRMTRLTSKAVKSVEDKIGAVIDCRKTRNDRTRDWSPHQSYRERAQPIPTDVARRQAKVMR